MEKVAPLLCLKPPAAAAAKPSSAVGRQLETGLGRSLPRHGLHRASHSGHCSKQRTNGGRPFETVIAHARFAESVWESHLDG